MKDNIRPTETSELKRHLDSDGELGEQEASLLKRAALFDPQSDEECDEALSWAQLDPQVGDQMLEFHRRHPERHIDYERFIGHDSSSVWYEVRNEMGDIKNTEDPDERASLERKYLLDSFGLNEHELPGDTEELDHFFLVKYYEAEYAFFAEASPAQKATYLEERLKIHFGGNEPDAVSRVDWLNEAPFELIDQTVDKLLDPDYDPVAAEREASALHAFGVPDIHPDAHLAYLQLDRSRLEQVKNLRYSAAELDIDLDTRTSILLYNVLGNDQEAAVSVLESGFNAESIIQHPWLRNLDPGSAEYQTFPLDGDLEDKYRWCLDNCKAQIPPGLSPQIVGKLMYEQLQAGYTANLESVALSLDALTTQESGTEAKPDNVEELTDWLARYSDTPLAYLAEAWRNRPLALLAGINDDPYEINAWAIGGEAETEVQPSSDDVLLLERTGQKFYAEPVSGKEAAIFAIERRAFPESLYKYSPNAVKGEQQIRQSVDPKYSFIVRKDVENDTSYAAYCLAKPKPDSATGDTKLYIFDFAVDSEHRGLGIPMFLETLARADKNDIEVVEFFGRESASYRMATSPTITRWLNRVGYDVSSIRVDSATGKEPLHKLRLEKRPKQ